MGEPQPYGRVRLIEMVVESVRVHMLSSRHVVDGVTSHLERS